MKNFLAYFKNRRFIVSLFVYALCISVAYNILLVRECYELKSNMDFILAQAQKLNDENAEIVDRLIKDGKIKNELKRIEITKEKGKYVEIHTIKAK